MLVITRREQEEIVLKLPDGREMKIVVIQLRNHNVRIGFLGPKDIEIQRYDEEQKTAKELLAIKKARNIKCDDKDFVKTWMDTPIPHFGQSARQVLRNEPLKYREVMEVLRKELTNANAQL